VALNRKDLIAIRQAIKNRHALFVEKQSTRITRWRFPEGYGKIKESFDVVYDKKRKGIVTIIPTKK